MTDSIKYRWNIAPVLSETNTAVYKIVEEVKKKNNKTPQKPLHIISVSWDLAERAGLCEVD